jgi:hypothetical protein
MAADTATKDALISEELHLYGLMRDDGDAIAIHVAEAIRHLRTAEEECERIYQSIEKLANSETIAPHARDAVKVAAAGLAGAIVDGVEFESLSKDSSSCRNSRRSRTSRRNG